MRVHVVADEPGDRAALLDLLGRAGVGVADPPEPSPPTVVLAVADTVDAALAAYRLACPAGERPLLVVADAFTPAGVRRAIRSGVDAMLRRAEVTPAQLLAAVQSARYGEGRLPYEILIRLLSRAIEAGPVTEAGPPVPLTARQTMVLNLMAEGHGNAAIARVLLCSEHTVKNVIYDLMARLQVRNRAHAVARAVRAGLI
ncbi:DNA-binding response regulator [Micromonospora echinofusca]|uniref:DNA-binding response regulator n=1 Tax=Micromonospora echinofusca TaxID=47858 RepID=A0ABS3VU30_MICEH|nr:DNA-binding response regulator [Micromonospora echinofusca]